MRIRDGLKALGILLVVSLFITGCAPTARTNVYTNPTLERGTITSLAIFPIRNGRLAPSESQQLNRKVTQALTRKGPNVAVHGPTETTDALNAAGLVDAYSQFVRDYTSSGVPDVKILRKIGDALKVDALLQGELTSVHQQDGVFGVQPALTRVSFRLSILSTKTGDILWEGTAEGVARGSTIQAAPPVFEALNVALRRLLDEVPPL